MNNHASIIKKLDEQRKSLTQQQLDGLTQLVKTREIKSGKISKKDPELQKLNIPFSIAVIEEQISIIGPGEKQNALIGSGSGGKLKFHQNIASGGSRVLKIIKPKNLENMSRVMAEADINVALKNSQGFFKYQASKVFLDLEYINGVDLFDFAVALDEYNYIDTFPERFELCQKAIAAIIDFHAKGYWHCDIKPENFMCEKESKLLKLIDFGFALKQNALSKVRCGTLEYLAPEINADTPIYNEKTEIYAAGWTLAGLLGWTTQEQPGKFKIFSTEMQQYGWDNFQYFDKIYRHILRMIDATPDKRPTFKETAEFFAKMAENCPQALRKKVENPKEEVEVSTKKIKTGL